MCSNEINPRGSIDNVQCMVKVIMQSAINLMIINFVGVPKGPLHHMGVT